ncbi:hypothetical protein [Flagellimonas hadalis]|nr:hypothetical protein [Allomuricauda hadalis]
MAKQDKKGSTGSSSKKSDGKGHIKGGSHKKNDATKGARTGSRPKKDSN